MCDETIRPALLVLEGLMALLIDKGVLTREEMVEALESAAAALAEQPDEANAAAVNRLVQSVRFG